MPKLLPVVLFSLVVSVVFLVACGQKEQARAAGPGASSSPPAAPVVVANVEQRDVPVQLSNIGNVEAFQMVQIRSMVNGQIEGVHFKEGQDVRKGQWLFTLDKRPFQADLEKAKGALQRDEAQAANAQAQVVRYAALEKEGVVAHEQADQLRAQAKADASAVYADRAAVDAARVQLQYTDIKAPIDARAGAVQIHLGNLVKANDTPFLVQLNQITPIYVTFTVPQSHLDEVLQYAARHLTVLAYPKGQSTNAQEGSLTFIDNGVDMQTGTIKLKATFVNKNRRLWPGEFVDVVLNLFSQQNAIVVPTNAIQIGQQGEYVYVVTPQSTAESRPVATAGTYRGLTLVSKGLAKGEQVVVEGQLRVAPNAKVVVQSTVPTSATPESSPAQAAAPAGGGGL